MKAQYRITFYGEDHHKCTLTKRSLWFFWVWIATGSPFYCVEFMQEDYLNELSKRRQ